MKEQTKVDWTKAPEGATHYCGTNEHFYKVSGEGCFIHLSEVLEESIFNPYDVSIDSDFIPRPVETKKGESKKVKYKLYVNEDSDTRAFFNPKLNKLSCFPFNDETTGDEIVNGSRGFIYWELNDPIFKSWFPKGLENYLVQTVYESGDIKPKEQTFEWKIKHIKSDDYKCGRDVALTILYKVIGDGYYEYKYAICSPKEMFSRKKGVEEALKKPDTWKVYFGNYKGNKSLQVIVWHLPFTGNLSKEVINLLVGEGFWSTYEI